jgi:hypothetical protein
MLPDKDIFSFYKCFSQSECNKFADLSGDYNQLHTDPQYARRSIAGGAAVHGMYLTLYALDRSIEITGIPTSLSAKFKRFVNIDDQVDFSLRKTIAESELWKIVGSVNNSVAIIIDISIAPNCGSEKYRLPEGCREQIQVKPSVIESPKATSLNDYREKRFFYDLASCGLTACPFGSLIDGLGNTVVQAMLSMTHFIGMICPGEDSVFSQFEVSFANRREGFQAQHFWLSKFDDRIHRYIIGTSGELEGQLIAFRRPTPVCQAHISDFRSMVNRSAFKDMNALVIGGSRGLGAAAAKILALGGAKVDITYVECEDSARSIVEEISEYSAIEPLALRYDVIEDDPSLISEQLSQANAILYFATPRIRAGSTELFDMRMYNVYLTYFVERLFKLASFAALKSPQTQVFFAPSSVFIETRQVGFAEYTLAKMAMEFLFESKNAKASGTKFTYSRFPQMKTDQTVSLFNQHLGDTFPIMYPVLKEMREILG